MKVPARSPRPCLPTILLPVNVRYLRAKASIDGAYRVSPLYRGLARRRDVMATRVHETPCASGTEG
jgi:hypothetical protein